MKMTISGSRGLMQDGDATSSSKASGQKVNGVHLHKMVAIQQPSNMSSVSEQQSGHQIASVGSLKILVKQ